MSNRLTNIIAVIILVSMFTLAITSMKDDSAIMDEVAHLPAGYSYLAQQDYRLNPEHPPLIKDLAAIPLLFMKINFPAQITSWTKDINGQWDFGFNFMYKFGNNADKMLFWGRLPILLLSLILGIFIFFWGRKLYGNTAALLALFLYAFSPNILAHSRFVTTDIAAAFGFFTAIFSFTNWLKKPDAKHTWLAGLFLGIALLMKFSTFMLLPLFLLLTIIWVFIQPIPKKKILWQLLLIYIIALLVMLPIYQYHVWKYPVAMQQRDIKFILASDQMKGLAKILVWMSDKPILRAYAQYIFGLAMVAQRATGGNTTYFLGDVSNQSWKTYFPIVYAIKEPPAMHLLTIITLIYLAIILPKKFYKLSSIKDWLENHFTEFNMLSFIALYWTSSITSNLNIGVRHILPTFPFIYLLVSGQVSKIFKHYYFSSTSVIPAEARLDSSPRFRIKCGMTQIILGILLLWYLSANLSIYPSYLAYFNELVGGAKNGYLYVVDSNLDWGQDLKRLAQWTEKNNIQKINVDYFGGGTPEYYLGDKFVPYHSHYGKQPGWLAVSATFYQTSRREPQTSYAWLDTLKPVTTIGYSIFVYDIK